MFVLWVRIMSNHKNCTSLRFPLQQTSLGINLFRCLEAIIQHRRPTSGCAERARVFDYTFLFAGTPLHSNERERTMFVKTVRNRHTTQMQRQPLQL